MRPSSFSGASGFLDRLICVSVWLSTLVKVSSSILVSITAFGTLRRGGRHRISLSGGAGYELVPVILVWGYAWGALAQAW